MTDIWDRSDSPNSLFSSVFCKQAPNLKWILTSKCMENFNTLTFKVLFIARIWDSECWICRYVDSDKLTLRKCLPECVCVCVI